MARAAAATDTVEIPAALSLWVTWLRAAVVLALLLMLIGGRSLAGLSIPVVPAIAVAAGALAYNAALALLMRLSTERPSPAGDRFRARLICAGGLLDTLALGLMVLLTGGIMSPWLYFFLASSIVSSAFLPLTLGRVLTAINCAAALIAITLPLFQPTALRMALFPPQFWSHPGYVFIVGLSLTALMGLTAYAVGVIIENARAAARFQQTLAQMASTLQEGADVDRIMAIVCTQAHQWFSVDHTVVTILEGEQLVVKAALGFGGHRVEGQRVAVGNSEVLEVEVLRRRGGLYVNDRQRSSRSSYPLVPTDDDAVLCVPLRGALGVLGVLTMGVRNGAAPFTPAILRRAEMLAAQAGIIVENARLLDRVREEAEGVTALLSASERLTKTIDLQTLLADINRIAAEMVQCDRSTTFLWDSDRQAFHFASSFGNVPEVDAVLQRMAFKRGTDPLIEKVFAGAIFVLSPEQAWAMLPSQPEHSSRPGWSAVVPLTTEKAMQGVMTVSYSDPQRDFGAEQRWMLRGIARHAALAIERARLAAQERQATATAEALLAFGQELSATLNHRQVLARIPEMATEATQCDFAFLGFWDPATHRARLLAAHGFATDAEQELLQLSLDTRNSPVAADVLRAGYIEIEQPQPLFTAAPDLMQHFGIGSLFCSLFGPLEQRVGSLAVGYWQRTGPFSTTQRQLVTGLAQQAAVAFENSRLVEDLRQADRLKSDFLSTVSHELRTPLNAIIGYTDLLRDGVMGPLQPEQLEALDVIGKKGIQLLDLINTTLDLTRLEAGQASIDVSEFELPDLLVEVQQELADEVPSLVELSCLAEAQVPTLRTDRLKLKTVLKNLVHNALKFTRQGHVHVRAHLAPGGSQVQLVVRDTGIGIAPGNVKAIFEMFRQVEPALTRHYGGAGLGLYIVQRLLDLLQGHIHVESEPGKGSTFEVTIPIRLN